MTAMTDDFDWTGESVVVPPRLGVAVYLNCDGDVIVRTQADPRFEEEDQTILLPRAHAAAVAASILETAGIGGVDPAPSTSAVRQRRYRERHHRNGRDVTRDGDGDGQTVTPLLLANADA